MLEKETVAKASDQKERPVSVTSGQPPKRVLRANTAEFIALQRDNLRRACEKYAWVAQRKNPLKQAPLKDWVYRRVAKADFGIPHIDKSGHKKLWYPDLPTMLAAYFEPEHAGEIIYHQDFLIAERIEFLPGDDVDDCRVLNLWRPPPWKENKKAGEPTVFLQHVAYLLDDDQNGD